MGVILAKEVILLFTCLNLVILLSHHPESSGIFNDVALIDHYSQSFLPEIIIADQIRADLFSQFIFKNQSGSPTETFDSVAPRCVFFSAMERRPTSSLI